VGRYEYRELIKLMNINQALIRKLKESSLTAESAWREDINQLHKSVSPVECKSLDDVFKKFVNLTISFITLKKALLTRTLKDNLDVKRDDVDYDKLLEYIKNELSPHKYLSRFSAFKVGIEHNYQRYGVPFKYDSELTESLFIAGVKNNSSRSTSDLKADLTLIEDKHQTSVVQQINDVVELKPNFAGVGINLNALISKLNW